ncbi:MAG: AAA family ATPase [bacterium]|nr:AAA family ATPase [bacterium]
MNDPQKISYYNLREEAASTRLPELFGRNNEMERLTRILGRRVKNNALVVSPHGIGKTALVYGWMKHMSRRAEYDAYALLQLDTGHLYALDADSALENRYAEAFTHLPRSVVFVDDFGREVCRNAILLQRIYRLYKHLLKEPNVHVVLSLEPHEYTWLEQEHPAFIQEFETILLKNQTAREYVHILSKKLSRLNMRHRVIVPDSRLEEIVSYTERFPSLGQSPQAAIHILDESLSFCASKNKKVLTQDSIAHIIEPKTGIPKARLTQGELKGVKELEGELNARIIDQKEAIAKIASALQRAKLGLRNPNRPLGSFLMLGPSGVGKTETAKCVAEIMFGRAESFTRFDMSEFQQDHTIQRLVGAPPGYVGYDEGGALTNALRKEPYSLILLDEIEKAHPKVFDIFLQVLDDGRLTSGQNETVDARNTIIMATSNAAVQEILDAYAEETDEETFMREKVLPTLMKTFRLEFLNRFDSILLFKPLSVPSLMEIAQLEIQKIEKRLTKHRVHFEIEPAAIEERIAHMADPRFGARPVKRFIEETCETLLARSLLGTT